MRGARSSWNKFQPKPDWAAGTAPPPNSSTPSDVRGRPAAPADLSAYYRRQLWNEPQINPLLPMLRAIGVAAPAPRGDVKLGA